MREKRKVFSIYVSLTMILSTYLITPLQISAREIENGQEQTTYLIEQEEKKIFETEEAVLDSLEIDVLDSAEIAEMIDSKEESAELEEDAEISEEESELASDELETETMVDRSDGYSHVESSAGVIVVTTPADATVETLAEYLKEYFQDGEVDSLTVKGMKDTGEGSNREGFGLAYFSSIVYLELSDVENVGQAAIIHVNNLTEIYLPSAKVIGPIAFWGCNSLLKLTAPVVEEIGINAFYDVGKLEILYTPEWHMTSDALSLFGEYSFGPRDSLEEVTIKSLSENEFNVNTLSNVEKLTLTSSIYDGWSDSNSFLVFSNTSELNLPNITRLGEWWENSDNLTVINAESVKALGTRSLASLPNVKKIELPALESLENPYVFEGSGFIELIFPSLTAISNKDAFSNAESLIEIYIPKVNEIEDGLRFSQSVELIGTSSSKLNILESVVNEYPSILIAATETNDLLFLEDRQIFESNSETLTSDLSAYILNEDLSQTRFDLSYNWFFEETLIGDSSTYTINNMAQNNVGGYQYSVSLTSKGASLYSGIRVSRRAQIDIIKEIVFTSDFAVSSSIGELQETEIHFTSNSTNINATIQISIPDSIVVDVRNIEVYLDNNGMDVPLGVTAIMENQVISIATFPLIAGFNYHIVVPLMPIGLSDSDRIGVRVDCLYGSVETSGTVVITSGEFTVSIPNQIRFEEVSLDNSSINSTIEKQSQLTIDLKSFTGLHETWEIMVQAAPFVDSYNQVVDESSMRLVYKEGDQILDLSEALLLSSGKFTGDISYDFQTDLWENNTQEVKQLQEEGFHIHIGNDYYKLQENQVYTTEMTFTIQYSP